LHGTCIPTVQYPPNSVLVLPKSSDLIGNGFIELQECHPNNTSAPEATRPVYPVDGLLVQRGIPLPERNRGQPAHFAVDYNNKGRLPQEHGFWDIHHGPLWVGGIMRTAGEGRAQTRWVSGHESYTEACYSNPLAGLTGSFYQLRRQVETHPSNYAMPYDG